MMILFAESALGIGDLRKRSAGLDILVLDPSVAQSEDELRLAEHLARKSMEGKKALARSLKYEFLLWLTGKTDIKSAMKKSAPKNANDMLIIIFSEKKEHVLKTLGAKEKKKSLKNEADALRLEEISLSRIKN